jgi:hypothetical protein
MLGIYHPVYNEGYLKNICKGESGDEYLSLKIYKVCEINLLLSTIFIIAYYAVIQNTIGEDDIWSYNTFCLSFILALISLFTIRVLANPPEFLATKILKLHPEECRDTLQTTHNERVLSFFYSFICVAFMILGILASYSIISEKSIQLDVLSNVEIVPVSHVVCLYLVVMPFLTIIVELLLLFFPPMIQVKNSGMKAPANKSSAPTPPSNASASTPSSKARRKK